MEGKSAAQWCRGCDQVGTTLGPSLGIPDFHKKISATTPYHCNLKAPCRLARPLSLPPRPPSNSSLWQVFLQHPVKAARPLAQHWHLPFLHLPWP